MNSVIEFLSSDRFARCLAILLALVIAVNIYRDYGRRPTRYRLPDACVLVEIDDRPAEITMLKFVCYPKIKPWEIEDATRQRQ